MSSIIRSSSSSSGVGSDGIRLRILSFVDRYKGGIMTDARRNTAITELLAASGDIRSATAQDLKAALRVLQISRLDVTDRQLVVDHLTQLLQQQSTDIETETEEEKETNCLSHPAAIIPEEDSAVEESDINHNQQELNQQPMTLPRRSIRTSSIPHHSIHSYFPDNSSSSSRIGISDEEWTIIKLLLANRDGTIESEVVSSLSPSARKVWNELKVVNTGPQPIPVPNQSQQSSTSSRNHNQLLNQLPSIDYSTAANRPKIKKSSTSKRSTTTPIVKDASSDSNDDDDDDDDEKDNNIDDDDDSSITVSTPDNSDSLVISPDITRKLIRMGVEPSLAKDNITQQTAEIVSPSSYTSFWIGQKDNKKDMKLFYEGYIISLLLDNISNTSLVMELASRRWFSLWLVVNGSTWNEAQAFLPLSSTPGLTAKQQRLAQKFAKVQSNNKFSSSSHPNRNKQQGKKKWQGGSSNYNSSGNSNSNNSNNSSYHHHNNNNSNSRSNKGKHGAGSKDNSKSNDSSTNHS